MKTALKFLAFLSLALGAFAQQGQMASSFTASSAAPHFTLNRATTAQESSIFFKTAGATTGGWRIYGSGITNQVLNVYSYQAGATVGAWSSTGLAVTGTSSATGKASFNSASNTSGAISANFSNASGNIGLLLISSDDQSNTSYAVFTNSGITTTGSITRVTTTNAVVYNTTSDARLKTNIRDFTESGPIIDGLRPRWFDWKNPDVPSDSENQIGFVAQEEHDVDPALARIGAVTVGDDDPEVITKQWQRSDSALIPILVAELKSLRARVAALEALNQPTP